MQTLFGIEMTDEYFGYLFDEQAKGKELKVVGGKVIAVERVLTPEAKMQEELSALQNWFNEYDNQVKQYQRCERLGLKFDRDIEQLDNEAKVKAERIKEIRKQLKLLV